MAWSEMSIGDGVVIPDRARNLEGETREPLGHAFESRLR